MSAAWDLDRPSPPPARPRLFVGRSAPYLHTDEIADLLNRAAGKDVWDSRKVRRWLQRSQAAIRLPGPGGSDRKPWVTTRDRLREVFPDIYDAILRSLPGDEFTALVDEQAWADAAIDEDE